MNDQIIIADKDAKYRTQVAEHFKNQGYQVETTDSALSVLCSLLENRAPVLLLGRDFDQKISSLDLIRLLRKCNRHLSVIMVSDAMPLPLARKLRQLGISCQALKPSEAKDHEELGEGGCAFEKNGQNVEGQSGQPRLVESAVLASDEGERSAAKRPLQLLPWLAALSGLLFGACSLLLLAEKSAARSESVISWIFLSFCALITAFLLLPIFRIKHPLGKRHPEEATEHSYPRLGK
jgi:CheY-like chemotaxis protein